jgi:hypothetical protein
VSDTNGSDPDLVYSAYSALLTSKMVSDFVLSRGCRELYGIDFGPPELGTSQRETPVAYKFRFNEIS